MVKSTSEIRQTFLDFFISKGHQIVPSSSLVPDNDPTLLFTNAGMNQFKNVFLGLDHRSYRCATTSQRCVRAGGKHNDLKNVGYTARHHTFFEMLGNFSFGDYFKYDAIKFAWELLTGKNWFNLPKEKLWITVYNTDDETYNIWAHEIGIPVECIIRIGDDKNKSKASLSNNFWQMGDIGPCGPCSEIFYDHGDHIWGGLPGSKEENGDRYVEIWNLVFMQYNRQLDGTLIPLPQPSVDTGMGLERIAAVLQNVNSNYEIDIFKQLTSAAAEVTGSKDINNKSLRVIADHIRSCAFLISDGVMPSNTGRGYVLRRIIRRAIRHGNMLGTKDKFFYKLVSPLIDIMEDIVQQLKSQKARIEHVLRVEEEQFTRTLERGLIILDRELAKLDSSILSGEIAFYLYDTYGLPLDLTIDVCQERNLDVDKSGFEQAMLLQRKRTRSLSSFNIHYDNLVFLNKKTKFFGYEYLEHQGRITALLQNGQLVDVIGQKEEAIVILNETSFYGESGGQIGDIGVLKTSSGIFEVSDTQRYGQVLGHHGKLVHGELKVGELVIAQVDKYRRHCISLNHTATHLLHAALCQTLGEHIKQKGSLINNQYLRFDFSHNKTIKPEQIDIIENIVNEQIRYNLIIHTNIMTLEEAKNKISKLSMDLFNKKYADQVRVLSMGNFSIELCSGTHAKRTGDIGLFHIISEYSIATGVRRIEAVTGAEALRFIHQQRDIIYDITKLTKSDKTTLVEKISILQDRYKQLEKNLQQLKNHQAIQECKLLERKINYINGVKVLIHQFNFVELKMLHTIIDNLKNSLDTAVIVLTTKAEKKASLVIGITKNLTDRIKANDIVNYIAQQIGWKGGGRPDLAHSGSKDIATLPIVLTIINTILATRL